MELDVLVCEMVLDLFSRASSPLVLWAIDEVGRIEVGVSDVELDALVCEMVDDGLFSRPS